MTIAPKVLTARNENRGLTGGVVPNRIRGVPATKKVREYNLNKGGNYYVEESGSGKLFR
jgi:hypothetical protein